MPGIFVPVRQGARLLVDGALRNPVPVAALEALGVDVKVAVNLHAQPVRELEPRARRRPVVSRIGEAHRDRARALPRAARARASTRSPSCRRART